jgi:hypothetical protein
MIKCDRQNQTSHSKTTLPSIAIPAVLGIMAEKTRFEAQMMMCSVVPFSKGCYTTLHQTAAAGWFE